MGYRWKPTASQRRAYAEKMQESKKFDFISSNYPIREGCYVEYVNKSDNEIIKGTIKKSTYRSDNQHSFTIELIGGGSKVVMGRNIYDRLLKHRPGKIAKDRENPLNNRNKH